jgi:hypothetical protein
MLIVRREKRSAAPASGTFRPCRGSNDSQRRAPMHGLIYLVGLIVVIMAILSFFGLR